MYKRISFSASWLAFGIVTIFNFNCSNRYVRNPTVVLIGIFLIASDAEPHFMCSSSVKYLFTFFSQLDCVLFSVEF